MMKRLLIMHRDSTCINLVGENLESSFEGLAAQDPGVQRRL